MKRSIFLGLLGGSMAQAAVRSPSDVGEDKIICDLAAEVLGKLHEGDFSYLAMRTHPRSLQMFRDYLNVIYGRLSERYGKERVAEVSGFDQKPEDLSIKNHAFMVRSMTFVAKKHPEVLNALMNATLEIVGGIVDSQPQGTLAHVMYRYNAQIKNREGKTDFIMPSQISLLKDPEHDWKIWSVMGSSVVARWWHRDLNPDAALLEVSL